jgi:uncharacterized repeat protein (TIGR03803 family)
MNIRHLFVALLCVILPAPLFAGDDGDSGAPTYKILHSFPGKPGDGAGPIAGVIRDADGNLYGTTFRGGLDNSVCVDNGCGVVFKVDKTGKETVLHRFAGPPDGSNPYGGVIRDADGSLYGTTEYGGTCPSPGCGVVFEVDKTGKETVLYSFLGGTDGYSGGRNP